MPSILITGANRGIGFELAKQYQKAGWQVFACCRNPLTAYDLKALNTRANNPIAIIHLDVANPENIKQLPSLVRVHALDILFNNAGVWEPNQGGFGTVAAEDWLEVFKVNTIAALLIAQVLIKPIANSELKIIANMSSGMASISGNTEGNAYAYRSSKAALNAITKSMAIDLKAQEVTVVAIDPGWVQTDMGGANAPTTPIDAVSGIREVLERVSLQESGSYIRYNGQMVPW